MLFGQSMSQAQIWLAQPLNLWHLQARGLWASELHQGFRASSKNADGQAPQEGSRPQPVVWENTLPSPISQTGVSTSSNPTHTILTLPGFSMKELPSLLKMHGTASPSTQSVCWFFKILKSPSKRYQHTASQGNYTSLNFSCFLSETGNQITWSALAVPDLLEQHCSTQLPTRMEIF